uniref:WGS project CBMG000000000 data, contig CS5907-c001376 n=1 Tax=Fusarium acuminatum CS5907 TaxID=1318461 RepID=A0A096PER6_9HYPO|nr:unnamed protein product [Fusarium acuminatum CS5907]
MKFFTIAVLLAGVSNLAEAWQLIAYEKDYSCNGGGRNRVERQRRVCWSFYPEGNSVWNVRGQSPGCKSVGDVVRSYKCANANGCRNRDEYSRCLAVCQTGCSFPGAVLGCAGACINSCHGAWGNAGC